MALNQVEKARILLGILRDEDPGANETALQAYASSVNLGVGALNIMESSYSTDRPPGMVFPPAFFYSAQDIIDGGLANQDAAEGGKKVWADLSAAEKGWFFEKATIKWWRRIHKQVKERNAKAAVETTAQTEADAEVDANLGTED